MASRGRPALPADQRRQVKGVSLSPRAWGYLADLAANRNQSQAEALERLIEEEHATMSVTTASGAFRVYHRDEAGAPDLHESGPWFFEPSDYSDGDVFSAGFATREEALSAAALFEAQEART